MLSRDIIQQVRREGKGRGYRKEKEIMIAAEQTL